MERQTSGSPKKGGKAKYYFLGFLLLAALAVVFLPSLILTFWLNRSEEGDAFVRKISAEKARIKPFFDGFEVRGLTVVPAGAPDKSFLVESVKGTNIKRASMLKLLFGIGDENAFDLLAGDATLEIRGVSLEGPPSDGPKDFRLNTFELRGLSLGPSGDLGSLTLDRLKITDFYVSLPDFKDFGVDSFAAFGLSGGILGGVVVSGLNYKDNSGPALSAGDFKADNVNLATVVASARNFPAPAAIVALANSMDGLDLAAFTLNLGEGEALYAKSLVLDTPRGSPGPETPAKTIVLKDLRANLEALYPDLASSPKGRVILSSFGPTLAGNLTFKGTREADAFYHSQGVLELVDSADVTFNLRTRNFSPARAGNTNELLLVVMGATFGDGDLTIANRGLGTRLYPALSENLFRGRPAKEGILEALEPFFANKAWENVINADLIQSEAALFVAEPRRVAFHWSPEPGFPASSAVKAMRMSGKSPFSNPGEFYDSIKYAILTDVNLAVSVNGRAPLYVMTGP
ncbi:MAG: hypothetical protein LBF41_07820 [Deltaproteobacteria bacterium]|jgi:hypothetical protein|nr:hypothetical protein [Deltaproteobacteria bacterium]